MITEYPAAQARILVGASDEAVARVIVRALATAGLAVAERALDPAGLLDAARPGWGHPATAGVTLVEARLAATNPAVLDDLLRLGWGLVIVGNASSLSSAHGARVVAEPSDAASLAEAVAAAALRPAGPRTQVPIQDARPRDRGAVVSVVSGHGGPGKTTLALNVAAALADDGGGDVALADLDLRGGNVALALRLRPDYNLFQLASALGAGHELGAAVAAELQQPRPRLHVLGGLAAPATMLADVTPGLVERLLATLARTHAWVVADVGSDFEGSAGAGHRAAVAAADLVLVVAEPSALGLWNLRLALGHGGPLAPYRERAAVVLNRFHPRRHHAPSEVAAAFPDVPVLGCVEHEYDCTEVALRDQRPLVDDRRCDAARAIRRLAAGLESALTAGRAPAGAVG